MTYIVIKYDMRAPSFGASREKLYRAAVEQCEWADKAGFGTLMLAEHHGSEDGYLPSPVTLAATIAGRTSGMRLRVQAMILPFHDPLRLAEDFAVLDIVSGGRAEMTAAGGYVASEFEMFGVPLAGRGRLVEESVHTMRRAWFGEPFEYRGRRVRVTPTPLQPTIPIALGGASEAAAKRAARVDAAAFIPAMPELHEVYAAECRELGKLPTAPERMGPVFLHVAEDPDEAWAAIAPHALHETNAYSRWMAESMGGAVYSEATDADALRASGAYQVVTPEQCIQIARDLGPGGRLALHPLMGGMDPELGWESLRLFADQVMPALTIEEPAVLGQHKD